MGKQRFAMAKRWTTGLLVAAMGLAGSASATLFDRGSGLIYDDQLNITWVQNASLCATLNNCVNRDDSFETGGMTWNDANTWAANLVYGGFDDWRLATINVTSPTQTPHPCFDHDAAACKASGNELGYMYYINLGGNFLDDKTGNQTVGGVTLHDIQKHLWSGTEFDSIEAWNRRQTPRPFEPLKYTRQTSRRERLQLIVEPSLSAGAHGAVPDPLQPFVPRWSRRS